MYAALPEAPVQGVSLAAGPASLRPERTRSKALIGAATALPWSSKDLVLKHRRLLGTAGIFSSGAAFGFALSTGSTWIGAVAALIGFVELLEGCVLAFPRPVRAEIPLPTVQAPPVGARL
jgi:hypothetical protein